MKIRVYKMFCTVLTVLTIFSSCKKESENAFTMFKGLKIDYKSAVDADDVYLEFKLTKASSGANMSKVIITEVGSTTALYTTIIPYTQRYTFESGVIVLKSFNPQTVNYKITVFDEANNDITSSVTVSYPTGALKAINPVLINDTETINFAEGSTVYIDYTVTSENADIKTVNLESLATGVATPARIVIATLTDNDNRRSYRGATRIVLNRDGLSRYRLYANNMDDDYIGDGYKHLNANVTTGFEFSANKFIYAPDTTSGGAKPSHFTSACFYSIALKKAFTYEEATKNSADIDFGIYLTPAISPVGSYNLNLYSPSDSPVGNPLFAIYDFSTWTKRTTKFTTAFVTLGSSTASVAFNDLMTSGLAIRTQASVYSIVMTRNRVVNIPSGSLILFRNQEGKFGAISINNFNKDYLGRRFANIDVKIEK